ncbi:MAG: NYN domain-containing protein [Phycisphaerales bacterium]|nr:MAG: NYN domain-containing protein [Phycisphaerales bacterium]
MPLIIDTYNVLHVVGILPPELAGIDVAGLAHLIGASRYRNESAMLVCDGVPSGPAPTTGTGTVTIRYAGPGRQADDLIAAMIRRTSAPRRLTVVSSDRQVLRAAARRRCKTARSEEFLRRLLDDSISPRRRGKRSGRETSGPLSRSQVTRWANIFGLDADAPPPEEMQPAEEELQSLLEREPDRKNAPTEKPAEPTSEDEVAPPFDVLQGDKPPPPAPTPILPGRIIREASSLLNESEARSEPGPAAGEGDGGSEFGEAPDSEGDVFAEFGGGNSGGGDHGGPVLPPEIIQEAEQLLAELEAGTQEPPGSNEKA